MSLQMWLRSTVGQCWPDSLQAEMDNIANKLAAGGAERCWKRVITSERFLITFIYTIVPEHNCIHTVTLVSFLNELCVALSELICQKFVPLTMLVEETLSKSKRKRKQTQMKRLCSLGRIS